VSQSSCDQHQSWIAIWKGADKTVSPAQFTQDALERIIDSAPAPMSIWGIVIGDSIFNAFTTIRAAFYSFCDVNSLITASVFSLAT
jgi:hypothetical protein